MYWTKWVQSSDGEGLDGMDVDDQFYKAQILLLAETKEELEKRIEGKEGRIKIPKILDSSISSLESSDDENLAAVRAQGRTKKALANTAKEKKEKTATLGAARNCQLKKIMAKKLENRAPVVTTPAAAARPPVPEAEPEAPNPLMKANKRLKIEVASLRTEVESLRKLNRRLQERLLDHLEAKQDHQTPAQTGQLRRLKWRAWRCRRRCRMRYPWQAPHRQGLGKW
ncbi:uncharacterized protein [Diadema antillarum]|uniref:uncharacterized protein n=1 Tax=Diadema antillarum TaxID=105358 RepID=UPI003A8B7D1A